MGSTEGRPKKKPSWYWNSWHWKCLKPMYIVSAVLLPCMALFSYCTGQNIDWEYKWGSTQTLCEYKWEYKWEKSEDTSRK